MEKSIRCLLSLFIYLRAEKEGFQERIYPKGRERRAGPPRMVESLRAWRQEQSQEQHKMSLGLLPCSPQKLLSEPRRLRNKETQILKSRFHLKLSKLLANTSSAWILPLPCKMPRQKEERNCSHLPRGFWLNSCQ